MQLNQQKAFLEVKLPDSLAFRYISILFANLIVSYTIIYPMWSKNVSFMHTVIELSCIFIAISAFIIVWLTHNFSTPLSHVIGFGYMAVANFDLFHIYFFPGLNLYPKSYFDLGARYWSLGRLAEALVILMVAFRLINRRVNRWIALAVTLIISEFTTHAVLLFPQLLPTLATSQGPTLIKNLFDGIIILILIVGLFKLRKNIDDKEIMTYRYFYMAILIAIPTELCYILTKSGSSYLSLLGHTLRLTYYIFLFKGIFISAVIYPYEKLKEEHHKLIQQEKLALLGQMGASIVHETKNSLAIIKGTSQLLNIVAKDESIKGYAQRIDTATNEVNRIICDFLNLSKPRPLKLDRASLNGIIESIKNTLSASLLLDGTNINISLSKNENLIICDEPQIKQVILNICKNAIEAMSGVENPTLTISTRMDLAQDRMLLTVSDNGKGMSSEEKSKIGTPFYTTKVNGTGLGLSVCFQIIRDHEGSINVESQVGKGTSFIIALPCVGGR